MTIREITTAIERFAPTALQEEWDNCGLIIGDSNAECTGVLTTLDVTEETVGEAIAAGCNLIVAHHPLIFKGLRRLNGSTPVERAVIAAVRGGVAVYAAHTSMDNARGGVSWRMAKLLGLTDVEVLEQQHRRHEKLSVFVPHSHLAAVRDALFEAGAGHIGNYDCCSYSLKGEGTFRALENATPFVGEKGDIHTEPETRLEVLLPAYLHGKVESALRGAHPYEEPAYEFTTVSSGADRHAGCGVVGNLPTPLTAAQLAERIKTAFGAEALRCSRPLSQGTISRVALCGGSGAFLIDNAVRSGAQAFVTADVKYHEFADRGNDILLVDAGHFETEHCITSIFYEIITEIFPNFAVRCASTAHNPVIYM